MIYLLFLGLLYTNQLRANDVDPCQELECLAGCSGYKDLCTATSGCNWYDTEYCLSGDGLFAADCCYSSDLISTTPMTPSPTSCDSNETVWSIDEIGQSSQFRFISDCNKNQFIKIKMVSLTEYDINDKKTKNKITSFASSDWYWITNEDDEYNGFDADINKYVSTLEIKGSSKKEEVGFNLTTVLFREEAEVGNETIIENTLKWTTDIDGWPFIDVNNTLELCINVMTNGGSDAKSEGDDERFTFNDFEFRLIDTAYCGDDEMAVETYKNQKNSNQMDICFIYDACDDVIDHDPFVRYVGDDDNGDNGGDDGGNGNNNGGQGAATTDVVGISVGIGIAAFVLLIIAVLAGIYCRKNEKLRKSTTLLNSLAKKEGYDALKDEA